MSGERPPAFGAVIDRRHMNLLLSCQPFAYRGRR
jgi:hypothetical protein